ncbi:MAG: UvrB/UvrC motif-containing protein [candidate division WOR-3 bacterium]
MMKKKCDLCHKNEASINARKTHPDDKVDELAVCAECAQKYGLAPAKPAKLGSAEVMAELKAGLKENDSGLVCSGCGMSLADFKRQGRLGCDACYIAFREELLPLIRRLHGATQHVGRTVKAGRKDAHVRLSCERIRDALAAAIKNEDYERAAALRDELRKVEDEAGQ